MRGIVFAAALAAVCLQARAADGDIKPEEIIQKFAAKELEFAQARNNYTYRQSLKFRNSIPAATRPAASGSWWRISFSRRKASGWKKWFTRRCRH